MVKTVKRVSFTSALHQNGVPKRPYFLAFLRQPATIFLWIFKLFQIVGDCRKMNVTK